MCRGADQLRAEFDRLDVNKSGVLERDELCVAMAKGSLSEWFGFMADYNPGG